MPSVSNSLDLDQICCFDLPNLGLNCLQRIYRQMISVLTSRLNMIVCIKAPIDS